jgi:two-component system sensor histidine kinase MprB
MSLRWRIAAALAGVAALVGIAAAVGAYLTMSQQLQSTIDHSLLTRAASLISDEHGNDHGPGRDPNTGGSGAQCPQSGDLQPATAAQLVNPSGQITSCLPGSPALPVDARDLGLTSAHLRTVNVSGVPYRIVTLPWQNGGVLELGRDLQETNDVLATLRLRLGLLAGAGVLVAAGVGWLIARHLARPIAALQVTAESIATTQDLTTAVPAGSSGEIGSLARSFTTMIVALAKSRDQQQQLVRDASHEMRTPLTSLTSNLELLAQFDRLPVSDRPEVIAAIEGDVVELTELLTQLVELATDPDRDEAPAEPTRLADIARDVARRTERRSGRRITVIEQPESREIAMNVHTIERAIANLLDNAVKYTPAGTSVEVFVAHGNLDVRDHGTGIDIADQPHIFARFYRATSSRSQPGTGLGLAIVAQTIERHGGTVHARNHPDGGAVIGFNLPG